MKYTVIFKPSADREFQNLVPQIQGRLADELASLEQNPRPPGCKKLRARPGFRVRVGDYRIIYAIDDHAHIVRVLAIGHRREIYE